MLTAGHQAPSVGHSQPWRFIVISEQATRDRAALLADRERLRQAGQLTPDRRARLLDLQLDGIREAPVGIVVACDRRAPAAGVLGRATFADADLWSCACAVENMWLAARAAGLGLGWVTLFQPADLAELLSLPDGVETLGWLCLGWPDERPPDPGLERHGWSRRLPLDDVVIGERWPSADEPSPPVSHLAGPDQRAVVAGRDTGDDLLAVPGSLGVLDAAVNRVLALSPVPADGRNAGRRRGRPSGHPARRSPPSPPRSPPTSSPPPGTGSRSARRPPGRPGWRCEAVHARPARPAGDLVEADAMSLDDVDRARSSRARALGRAPGRPWSDLPGRGRHRQHHRRRRADLRAARPRRPRPPSASAPAPTRRWSRASATSSPAPSPGRAPTTATGCATRASWRRPSADRRSRC